jgi:hypothetical protein
MAKKVRTPPPPRKVQVPQRRDTRRSGPAVGGASRPPWLYAVGGAVAGAIVAAIVLGVVLTRGDDSSAGDQAAVVRTYNSLPGVRRTEAPWPPEYEFLADRLLPLGLTPLSQEGLATHYHSHLDIFVDGKRVLVPPSIGINPGANYITELHTHDSRGLLHVESPDENDSFTLGQFMAEWGVFLNGRCVGAYCDNLRWYVNGERQTGNPQTLTLEPHQEIAIVVGKPPAVIPKSFEFRPGE